MKIVASLSGLNAILLRLQGWVGNNAAGDLRVLNGELAPHPLDGGEGTLIVTAGQWPGPIAWCLNRSSGLSGDSHFRAHGCEEI